ALIDDDTPTPPHARFGWWRFVRASLLGIALAAGTLALLAIADGRHGTLTAMGWLFTKAALLTFGGAYAVLPYLYQNSVDRYSWLTPTQMLDGLALGETTPGPLIMIVAFIGFVGGWTHHPLADPLASAIAAACIATWFTFVPSFVFILAGGPLVESTRGNLHLTAPLTAISAAVVGVILSLAMMLGAHAILGHSLAPAAICLAALVALVRYKIGTITLITASAAAGLLARAAGL
ncbi:chromate transporter, partial [Massilia arenosa]